MCIICNVGELGAEHAANFLTEFRAAGVSMRKAADEMHKILQGDIDAADRKRYDRAHKHMVRLIREWNGVEEEREQGVEPAP